MRQTIEHCPCGSDEIGEAEFDARGIFLDYLCNHCRDKKLRKYRPEVLTDPNYETDEEIEEDN